MSEQDLLADDVETGLQAIDEVCMEILGLAKKLYLAETKLDWLAGRLTEICGLAVKPEEFADIADKEKGIFLLDDIKMATFLDYAKNKLHEAELDEEKIYNLINLLVELKQYIAQFRAI